MKEKIFKSVALAMCALLLSLSVVNASCIRVNAATVTHASLYKVADMALAKTGIVANNDIITSLIDDIFADVQTVYDEFVAYCESLSIDIADATTETWNDFVTQCTDAATAIINEFPDMVGLVIWLCTNALTVTMENIADYIVGAGTEGITNGVGYKIADEAVKQCRRGVIPSVEDAISFEDAAEHMKENDFNIFCYEDENKTTLKEILRDDSFNGYKNIGLIIGPEGGFSEKECSFITEAGAASASLGKTILRVETASVAAMAMLMYELEQ